jgi:hypothetical protein
MWGFLLAVGLGAVYGFFVPGRERQLRTLGIRIGAAFIAAIALSGLALYAGVNVWGDLGGTMGETIIGGLFAVVLFVGGTVIGDWLESQRRRGRKSD